MPRPGPVASISPLSRAEFGPSALTDDEQSLALLCQELGDLPEAAEGTLIGSVQRAFHAGRVREAIRTLTTFLEANGLDLKARKYLIDPGAFKYQRRRKRLTQEALGAYLGVRTSQISHVEQNRNSLSLPRLLLALTLLDVEAREILETDAHSSKFRSGDKAGP
jgi:DNA-binding transcriptional regulator YiaG